MSSTVTSAIMSDGNTVEKINDIFRLSPKASAIQPAVVGPSVQPASPARARRANILTPPFGILSVAMHSVPGHIMPTEKPQTAHPTSERMGYGESAVIR